MEPDDLLCSRNVRLQKALVRRAHSRIGQVTPLREKRASVEGLFVLGPCSTATVGPATAPFLEADSASSEGLFVTVGRTPPINRIGSECDCTT